MIVNSINCLLSSKDIGTLRGFKDCTISIFTDVIDGKTVIVKLQRDDEVYFVTNEPTVQMDGDEYPVLRITANSNFPFTENFALENVKLLSICLIRDKLSWTRDGVKWEVEMDIGMKIITTQKEIYFIAMDSVAGLMDFTFGDKIKIPDSTNDLKKQWIYKTDEFISVCREQVPIV